MSESRRNRKVGPLAFALALATGGVGAGEPVWPGPAPLPREVPQQGDQGLWMPRQQVTRPDFQAPSARSCSQTPAFTEVKGEGQRNGVGRGTSLRLHDAVPASADLVVPPSPPAPPAPAPAYAPVAEAAAVSVSGSKAVARVHPGMPRPRPTQGPVTAGVVDDNADFSQFLQFLQRHEEARGLGRDVSLRHRIQVRDGKGRVVPDAEVAVSADNGARFWLRTDAGGQGWIFPNAFDASDSPSYRVDVRHGGRQVQARLQRGQRNAVDVVLPQATRVAGAKLDLVFMVDATGSMSDEIDKLRGSLQDIVRQIGQLPSAPDICLGLVTYRDRHDEYLLRSWDLTGSTQAFQSVLDKVRADGGGDYPEAMNQAFAHAVQKLAWRGDGTTRLLLTLADAPPHLDDGSTPYQRTLDAAAGKGIKVLSVAASGQDRRGEAVQRQMAQYTGGRFIFLTYKDASDPSSGAGTQTSHDVSNYSVDTLDTLVVRLVREELAKLPKG